MKKVLKLDHASAEGIRKGSKTSIWSIYDDKNFAVNDEIELVDKVDSADPSTWKSVGEAIIDRVVEKRLRDIKPTDFDEHETYESPEQMLEALRVSHGPELTLETPVKIINFTLAKEKHPQDARPPTITEAKLYADGGSRGNPGPSASGYAITDMDDELIIKNGTYLGVTTNNQAEYRALKVGLEEAHRLGVRRLHVYMDSMLVVNQMKGIFKVKNRDLWPIHDAVKVLVGQFDAVMFTHIPRELNKVADAAVNEVLDNVAAEQ